MKIILIGAGNVAWHLAPALKKTGHEIIAVYSKTKKNADALARKIRSNAINSVHQIPDNADLYLVALKDNAIASFVKSLPFTPNIIVHTSGSVPLSVFPPRFKNTGVIYPLQSFSKDKKINLKKVPFLLEYSNAAASKFIKKIASGFSPLTQYVNSEKRKRIHLAAVFANNFVNHLYSISSDLLKEEKLSFDLLKPLIIETTDKIKTDSPVKMQTGPARRNDTETIREHLRLLSGDKSKKDVYDVLTKSIIKKYS